MLNFALKGTYQDPLGYSWDYYRDDQLDPRPDPNAFYIIPQPQFVLDNSGNPSFQVLRYATDDKTTNGSGYLRFDIELSLPANIQAEIAQAILANPTKFPGVTNPNFPTLTLNRGGKAYFNFSSGGSNITFSAPVSSFGGNVASFLLQMTKEQLDTLIAAFTTGGGAYEVEYQLSVPARLQGVSAVLTFDSSIAYSYQVTQPSFDRWGDETSPGSVQTFLNESASSHVGITWGLADPPEDLKKDVTDWANKTLADLVSAEVQKVIQLQAIQSGQSFNINECSSFTSTYTENMVINWIISPKAALPSFTSKGWDMANFTKTVNEQQQQMAVTVFMPFKSDSADAKNVPAPTMPGGGAAPQALVDHVDVTVTYPGLSEANAKTTFSANGTHTFTAPYDTSAGSAWSLIYAVTYVDPNMGVVNGSVGNIQQGTYTLEVEAAGILTVVFDATQAFQSESVKPTEIDVDLSFMNRDGTGNPIRQTVKIMPPPTGKDPWPAGAGTGSITSFVAKPISTPYNYQLTYVFPGAVQYQPALVIGSTGPTVVIPAADAVHQTNLSVFSKPDADNPVAEVSVQMYYAAAPGISKVPNVVGSFPTKDSPAVFTLTPPSVAPFFQNEVFVGFLTGDQPLIYSASINAADGEVDIDDQPVDNAQGGISVGPNNAYFTLQINPEAIDWSKADQVIVLVQMYKVTGTGTTPKKLGNQKSWLWNTGDSSLHSRYYTQPMNPNDTVTYDWEVDYLTPTKTTEVAKGTGASNVVLNIPATSKS